MSHRIRIAAALLALGMGCGDDAMPDTDAGPALCATNADCDDGVFCNGSETCSPGTAGASAIGCVPAGSDACMEGQTCDEEADTCTTLCDVSGDADEDGVLAMECGGDDCDDSDPLRYPGNTEVCDADGVDEDCDPSTIGERDIDRDGQVDAVCCNTQDDGSELCGTDCDDLRASVSPTGTEACDGFDNDCDGMTDEGVLASGWEDLDGDQHGDPDGETMACAGSPRFADIEDDCDDDVPQVHGAQVEICDSVDNDCDGETDENTRPVAWYADTDGDGFGNAAGGVEIGCAPPTGYSALGTDCDDDRSGVNPAAEEICDGRDNDCNGVADYRIGPNDYEDDDGDGFTDAACSGVGDDCDDTDSNTGPGQTELCDGRDNDCDGMVDEDAMAVDWFRDVDGDGYGEGDTPTMTSCEPPVGMVREGGDCDDSNPDRSPAAPDRCDGVDDDCDGTVDEDALEFAYFADSDGDGAGSNTPVLACSIGAGLGLYPSDCDDDDDTTYPGADELCDGVDNDCDSTTDEGGDALCDGPNATGTCGGASGCNLSCTAPFLDCDSDDSNGCEVDPRSNADHCNGCDNSCGSADGGSVVCVDSACELSCDSGFDDCNDDPIDGCEVDLTSDVENCGTCGIRCLPGDNQEPMCTATGCDATCLAGYEDCDGEPSNGCESRLASDPANCGSCGMACTETGAACVSDICFTAPFPSDESDGALMVTSDTVLTAGTYEYTTVYIATGATLTTDGTGVLEIYASGDIVVDGTIDVSGSDGGDGGRGNGDCDYMSGGGATANALAPGQVADGTACYTGGLGGTGTPGGNGRLDPDASNVCAADSGGRYGGGAGGTSGFADCTVTGAGGGGYAGGGGGNYCDATVPGGDGAGVAGVTTAGAGVSDCSAIANGAEPGYGAYSGADGGVYLGNSAGGGGSIGRDAIMDLAVATTFRPGSGGGGGGASGTRYGGAGGGAGGALRLASHTAIRVNGQLLANGGRGGGGFEYGRGGGGGSGGVIYLAAPDIATAGEITAVGGGSSGGLGRIRMSVDPDRCALAGTFDPPLASGCDRTSPAVTERVYIDTYPY